MPGPRRSRRESGPMCQAHGSWPRTTSLGLSGGHPPPLVRARLFHSREAARPESRRHLHRRKRGRCGYPSPPKSAPACYTAAALRFAVRATPRQVLVVRPLPVH
eukprot:scaffold7759_cov471-Prasinococcus_capsulatus_cf.AAC.5